ncbi:hypothetical protein NG99_20955 [Erwinia typographi]|uniref:Uncharacterized protein n=1 Tax=Erwinia typographi TaxID=371042 RepID=A0A0A3ZST4_9GAMM|nr:hypothetical protein [Erwinia typographi]KGT88743.1 hypothetical protein NG99_20955 [Erwinia typographi]
MSGIIFHGITAAVFLIMGLSAGAGLLFHGHEYTAGQFWNMVGLCVASGLAWLWAATQAKDAWYIMKSR